MNQYQPVIGLEIHIELKTKSKMFCQCSADHFAKKPNENLCPVCLGLPGALPVPNKKAVEWTILLGQALNCQINNHSKFDRKHYFYPDLPKGYQISQYDEPIAINGQLQINSKSQNPNIKTYKIQRVHLEEDTGKLIHKSRETLVDFNRSGVPLIEVVTQPDFDNAGDVKRFLEELQVIVRYLNISDADMEKGSMRLEPNISVKKLKNNQVLPNYKVEIKNINSFRFVKQAIEYEIKRQIQLLEKGLTPKQETRGFDSVKQTTYSQRSKEAAHDYRYFPEPDIPPMVFENQWLKKIKNQLPELPQKKMERYLKNYSLKDSDAFILTRDKQKTDYFETVISRIPNQNYEQAIAKLIVNKKVPTDLSVDEFIKKAVALLTPQTTDVAQLETLIKHLIKENKKVVDDYKKGKENAIMFLVGLVMRAMKGKANPKLVISKIKNQITKL